MKNILENNKLIAEFMGLKPKMESPDVYVFSDMPYFSVRENNPEDVMNAIVKYSKYDSDWSWLMEVVEKIESLPTMKDNGNFFFEIHQDSVTVFNSTCMDIIIEVIGQESRINNTYQAVIEFIQWYNKQNKNNEKHLRITDRRTKWITLFKN